MEYGTRHWGPNLGPLLDYTCDEPPNGCQWSDIAPHAAAVHKASPNLRTLVTTTITEAQNHNVTDSIDILVALVNFMDNKGKQYPSDPDPYYGNQRSTYDAFLQSGPGKELWLYQSCMSHGCGSHQSDWYWGGWASYMIDASGVRNRGTSLCWSDNTPSAVTAGSYWPDTSLLGFVVSDAVALLQLQHFWRTCKRPPHPPPRRYLDLIIEC